MKLISFIIICLIININTQAQTDSLLKKTALKVETDLLNLAKEEKKELQIYIGTQKNEPETESMFNTTVISGETIHTMGCVSITDALKLFPGLIVRQKSNGVNHVQISGIAGNLGNSTLITIEEPSILVMVNNIPMNDRFEGGIIWEALPVSINEIERIELVRGNHTAIAGSNAMNAVINIITTTQCEKGLVISANASGGSANSLYSNLSVHTGISDKLKLIFSGNLANNNRFEEDFYVSSLSRYIPADSLLFYQSDVEKTNNYTKLSTQRISAFAGISYQPTASTQLNMTVCYRKAQIHTVLHKLSDLIMNQRKTETTTVALFGKSKGINFLASLNTGSQNLAEGYNGFKHNLQNYHFQIDKNLKWNALSSQLGVNVSQYNSKTLSEQNEPMYMAPGNRNFGEYSAFLINTYTRDKIKLLGAFRYLLFPANYDNKIALQLAADYRFNSKTRISANYGYGSMAPTAVSLFTDDKSQIISKTTSPVKLASSHYASIDLRNKLAWNSETSIEIFYRNQEGASDNTNNYSAWQVGTTLQYTFSLPNVQLRGFLTAQKSRTTTSFGTINNQYMPSLWGGVSGHYVLILDKLYASGLLYAYTNQSYTSEKESQNIKGKLFLDLKIDYRFWKRNSVYVSMKHLSPQTSIEFPYADHIKIVFLAGLSFDILSN
jgi:iron complex outermembrane recepter protein